MPRAAWSYRRGRLDPTGGAPGPHAGVRMYEPAFGNATRNARGGTARCLPGIGRP